MFRRKNLATPILAALSAAALMPAAAQQIALDLSTFKDFRQFEDGSSFGGGTFDVSFYDGNVIYVSGCYRSAYWPPNIPRDPCPGGSTGFLTFGSLGGGPFAGRPYFWITDILPAIIVEPRQPSLVSMVAAPTSDLRRPLGGFRDGSIGAYFNLHTTDVREYLISRYNYERNYNKSQLGRFDKEIVPGVYHYEFPRLGNTTLRARISPVVYPMPEGPAKLNNQKTGVRFNDVDPRFKGEKGFSGNWNKKGFYELSYIYPNTVRWSGFEPSRVYPAVDKLYFSIRFLSKPGSPKADVTYTSPTGDFPASLFPAFINGGDPRVLLPSPYTSQFTLPPILPSGTKGVVELELNRDFQTGGVTFDTSARKFQIPIMVVNYFNEYADLNFGRKTQEIDLLDDFDGDGYNNLTEWILETSSADEGSVPDFTPITNEGPPPPGIVAKMVQQLDPATLAWAYAAFFPEGLPWYGFAFEKQRKTVPAVRYILQRSTNGGRTWRIMKDDNDWFVVNNRTHIGIASRSYNNEANPPAPLAPAGTARHEFRVKIVLNNKGKKGKKNNKK